MAKEIWLLIPDYDYEGYGEPEAGWDHKPSRDELILHFISFYGKDELQRALRVGFEVFEDKSCEYNLVRLKKFYV